MLSYPSERRTSTPIRLFGDGDKIVIVRTLALKTAAASMLVATMAACSLAIDTSGFSSGEDAPTTNDAGGSDAPPNEVDTDGGSDGGPTVASNATMLSGGARHTCALSDGTLRCWGANGKGQLGDGSKVQRNAPVTVVGLPGKPTVVSAGDTHTCAIVDEKLYCWGEAGSGRLGKGASSDTIAPVLVPDLPAPVTAVSAGANWTCAVAASRAYCFGANDAGQLGDGTTSPGHAAASAVVDAKGIVENVVKVSSNGDHSCLLTSAGAVMCWGHHDYGTALGNPSVDGTSARAVPVIGLPGPASDMFMAGWHGCALVNGGVWCWGRNDLGELGNGKRDHSVTPVQPVGLASNVTMIHGAGGDDDSDATCALHGSELVCWGAGQYGRLGYGAASERDTPTKVDTTSFPQAAVVSLAGGFDHFCAAFANGEIRCWGQGKNGELGDGKDQDSFVPVTTVLD